MTGQQLKNSILQMAVQGKLVPQDPNDEPASVLIERIRKEKEQLIKEGKIKKEKNPSYIFRGPDNLPYEKVGNNEPVCIADEVPFEIPNSWEWVRLSNIFSVLNGDRGKNYPAKSTLTSTGIPFISALNLNGRTVVSDDRLLCMTEAQYDKLSNGKLIKGDVVVCVRGSLGKHGRYPFDKGAIASSLVILRCHLSEEILAEYIMLWLDSPVFFSEIKKYDNGTAQPNLAAKSLEQFIVPFPPLSEQQRIVNKINEAMPVVAKYDTTHSKVKELNETFPEVLKRSILQWAVQGRLVPQNPTDEPASVLLERIREEKQHLIKEGKIKKDKHESFIFRRDNSYYEKLDEIERCIDDEIPFELPVGWRWSRLGICLDVRDGTHDTPRYVSDGVPLITSKNLSNGQIDFSTAKLISKEDSEVINQRSKVDDGDIMYAMIGSIGNPVLYQGNDDFSIKNMALFKQIPNGMCMNFVYWFLILAQSDMKQQASGAVQSFVSLGYIRNYLIPIPPLAEQQRIARRLDSLFNSINALRQQ